MKTGIKKGLKKLFTICLSTAMLPISPLTSSITSYAMSQTTECVLYTNTNEGAQNYTTYASTVKTAIVSLSDSSYMRFMADAQSGYYTADYVTSDGRINSIVTIEEELPIFGAFYDDGSFYYILSGQKNTEENDSVEVYRLTKYDHDWNRKGSASVYGANTYIPFEAGSARIDSDGSLLFVRTCHQMYTHTDGIRHQANVTLEFNTDTMTYVDGFTGIMTDNDGYVSHSFNQFIRLDHDYIVSVDHGDDNPRSIVLMKTVGTYSASGWTKDTRRVDLLSIDGTYGNNATGVSVGGFEVAADTYVTAYNAVAMGDSYSASAIRNIYVAAVDKELSGEPVITQITNYTSGSSPSTPSLVKVSDNRFLLLWTRDTTLYYVSLDGSGTMTDSIHSISDEALSDCAPIVANDKIVWFTYNKEVNTLYEIPVNDLSAFSKTRLSMNHTYSISEVKDATCVEDGYVIYTCKSGDAGYTEVLEKDPDNHVGGTEVRDAAEATCISAGYTGDTYCLSCGELIAEGETIPVSDKHSMNISSELEATCQHEGLIEYTCDLCNNSFREVLPIVDHKYEDYYCIWCNCYGGMKSPVTTRLENVLAGVKVYWKAVDDAVTYRILRQKSGDAQWDIVDTVKPDGSSAYTYTDSTVAEGETYRYCIVLLDKDNKVCSTEGENYLSIHYLKALTAADLKTANTIAGTRVTFPAVGGAESYNIYRKTGSNGTYAQIGTIKENGSSSYSYNDSTVESGTTYYYSIRSVCGSDISSYAGKSIYCLKAILTDDLTTANSTTGARVSFPSVKGAESYNIYRKLGSSGTYEKIGSVNESGKASYSYNDTTAQSGNTYYYSVRAVKGSTLGQYAGKSIYYLKAILTADLTTANTTTGARVTFPAVKGAASYNVYRKIGSNGTYEQIGSVTESGKTSYSFNDTSVVSGTTYYYSIRAVKGSTLGNYAGKSLYYLKAILTADLTTSNTISGARVTFPAVKGAASYNVYRKTGSSGTYERVGSVTESGKASYSYTDATSESGTTYYYCVRAVKGSTLGQYAGKSIYYLKAILAEDLTLTNVTSGITIKWPKIAGAAGYLVYRKTTTGSYTVIKDVTSQSTISYIDTEVKTNNSTTYIYCVRPYYKDYRGSYTTKSFVRLSTPKIPTVTNVSTLSMTVSYGKTSAATGYEIMYSTSMTFSSGNTTVVTDTTSKTISGLTKGKIYYVRVRTYYTEDGIKNYSAWSGARSVTISR